MQQKIRRKHNDSVKTEMSFMFYVTTFHLCWTFSINHPPKFQLLHVASVSLDSRQNKAHRNTSLFRPQKCLIGVSTWKHPHYHQPVPSNFEIPRLCLITCNNKHQFLCIHLVNNFNQKHPNQLANSVYTYFGNIFNANITCEISLRIDFRCKLRRMQAIHLWTELLDILCREALT